MSEGMDLNASFWMNYLVDCPDACNVNAKNIWKYDANCY